MVNEVGKLGQGQAPSVVRQTDSIMSSGLFHHKGVYFKDSLLHLIREYLSVMLNS